jgi:hypothetical protein
MNVQDLTSTRYELDIGEDAIEFCYQKGWTDGLPVVPPTEERVLRFLEVAGRDPSEVVGVVPVRGRVLTVEKVAINAVMAGCRPEYMPVVLAALEAMMDERFNLDGSSVSTGGSGVLVVVNGPVRQALGFNSQTALFGPGPNFRANATVGRAIRLVLLNALGYQPGVLDRAAFAHPGRYTYCIAEDEENSPWEPLHVERGFRAEESTVTVFTAMGPWQVTNARAATPELTLAPIIDTIKGTLPNQGELVTIIGWEHRLPLREAGWSKRQVKEYIWERSRRSRREWVEAVKGEAPIAGGQGNEDPEELVPAFRRPEDLVVLAAGGHGGVFSVVIPMWVGGAVSRSVTRRIDTSRIL